MSWHFERSLPSDFSDEFPQFLDVDGVSLLSDNLLDLLSYLQKLLLVLLGVWKRLYIVVSMEVVALSLDRDTYRRILAFGRKTVVRLDLNRPHVVYSQRDTSEDELELVFECAHGIALQ